MARAISTSAFLVTISGYSGKIFFSGKSGGGKTASTSDYNDGITRTNRKIKGSFKVDDLNLERAYEPDVDSPFIRFLNDYCPRESGDLVITVQAIESCTASNPIGSPITYTGVQPLGYEFPDVDRTSDSAAMMKYMFSCDDVSVG